MSMTGKVTSAERRNIPWVQIIGSTGSMLLLLTAGTLGGSTSPHLAILSVPGSPIPITLDEGSWMASLMNLGRLVGAIPGAAGVYFLGSKKTQLLNSVPLILSWTSYVVADSVVWLYIGRFFGGFAMGVTYGSFPLYLGEVSSPAIRGALVTYAGIGLPMGTVIGNAAGAYVSLRVFGIIGLVLTIILIGIFMCVPESPHHLIRVNKIEEAAKSIARYNPGVDIETELLSLQNFVNASKSITIVDKLREFNIPANRKAGIVSILLYVFMQFSGMNNIFFYMEIILTSGGLTVVSSATMVIIAGVTGTISGLAAIYLSDKLGRKLLWNISSFGLTVAMFTLGAYFTLLGNGADPTSLQCLMIISLLAFEVFLFIGICPIPNTVLSELFASNIRSIAACFASISVGLFSFIAAKTYQPMLDATNETVVFWIYAFIASLGLIFGLTIMPETKGKSLQEIQNMLHKNSRTRPNEVVVEALMPQFKASAVPS